MRARTVRVHVPPGMKPPPKDEESAQKKRHGSLQEYGQRFVACINGPPGTKCSAVSVGVQTLMHENDICAKNN